MARVWACGDGGSGKLSTMAAMTCTAVLFCLALGLATVSGQGREGRRTKCRLEVDNRCGHSFIQQRDAISPSDRPRRCGVADIMIGCSADVIADCDVMEAAHTAETVIKAKLIRAYSDCTTLGNANLAVYAEDECQRSLAGCLSILLSAVPPPPPPDTTPTPLPDPVSICLRHQRFRRCTDRGLTACSPDVLAAVDKKVRQEKERFDDQYQCHQRRGEMQLEQCLTTLNTAKDILERDALCRLYEETLQCAEDALGQGTVDLSPDDFQQKVTNATAFALQLPFFCQADNPCLETVRDCNATVTTSSPPQHPCELTEVYDDCLKRSLVKCDQEYKEATILQIEQDISNINRQYYCQEGSGVSRACDQVARTCSQPLREVLSRSQESQATVCQAVDQYLSCAINGSGDCDLVSKADLKSAMNAVVSEFTTLLNTPCVLERAGDPGLLMTPCEVTLSQCSSHLFQADTLLASDPRAACSAYQAYVKCMREDLQSCDDVTVSEVRNQELTAREQFTANPYFCDHRDDLSQLGPQDHFALCQNDFLSVVGSSGLLQACTALATFRTCVSEAQTSASTEQGAEFQSFFSQLSQPLSDTPFFCTADNPCLERFQDCRNLSAQIDLQPCDELLMLQSCRQDYEPTCGSDNQSLALRGLEIGLRDDIQRLNQCPEPVQGTSGAGETVSSTTTASQPTSGVPVPITTAPTPPDSPPTITVTDDSSPPTYDGPEPVQATSGAGETVSSTTTASPPTSGVPVPTTTTPTPPDSPPTTTATDDSSPPTYDASTASVSKSGSGSEVTSPAETPQAGGRSQDVSAERGSVSSSPGSGSGASELQVGLTLMTLCVVVLTVCLT